MRHLTTLLLGLALMAPTVPAFAGEGKASAFQEIATELNLSTAQRTAVEEALYKARSSRIEIKARLAKGELDLKHALGAATLDEKAVASATDVVSKATTDLVRNRVDQIVSIRKQLNAEQWEKLKVIWGDMKEEREDEDDG